MSRKPSATQSRSTVPWALKADIHVSPKEGIDPLTLPSVVASFLKEGHGIDHVTVQVDPRGALLARHA